MLDNRYKLVGFTERDETFAKFLIRGTGKLLEVPLDKVVSSNISNDLSKDELKEIFKKHYSSKPFEGAYEVKERKEKYWIVYSAIVIFLTCLFTISNIAGIKPIDLFGTGLVVPFTVFIYPFSFILVDILNEFFGLRLARKAIGLSVITNIVIVYILYLSTLLPSIEFWSETNNYYSVIINSVTSVFFASISAYFISENVNAFLLNKIKEFTNTKYLPVRVIISTLFASLIDSAIFILIAFYGTLPNEVLKVMFLSQITIKLAYSIFGLIPIYIARHLFKKYIEDIK
ncbi:queuosine precursor transporter [Vibrio caribbeanicus]|uniref:queuosine precursor transporter n=1 Tax=Vibrio caribbeanicus TaxID=701175 RepID=UPI0030DC6E5F